MIITRSKKIKIKNELVGISVTNVSKHMSKGSSTLETVIIMSVLILIILALIFMMENMMFLSYYITTCNYKSYNKARENQENTLFNTAVEYIKAEIITKTSIFDFFIKDTYFEEYPCYSIVSNSTHYNNYRVLRAANNAEYMVRRLICLAEVIKERE